jgi:diguanylate cyclase (GGDEF)-like protein
LGLGRPEKAAAQLAALAAQLAPGAPARTEALIIEGSDYAAANDRAGVERIAQALLAIGTPQAQAGALLVRARQERHEGSLKHATAGLEQALKLHKPAAPDTLRYRITRSLGWAYESAGKPEKATEQYLEAIKLADALARPWRSAQARVDLAWLYITSLNQPAAAARLAGEALTLAQRAGDPAVLCSTWHAQSLVHRSRGEVAAALQALERSLSYAQAAESVSLQALMLGNISDHYLQTRQWATALAYAERTLPLALQLHDPDTEQLALANRGLARVGLGQLEAGKRDLAQALAIDEQRGNLNGMAQLLEETGRTLESAGDLRGALQAYMRYRPLADQAFQNEQQKAVLELQEGFDHARREREIQLLDSEALLKQELLRAQVLHSRLWLLGAVAAGLVLTLVLLMARRVRRDNATLAQVNAQLLMQSERDPLTGLANRRRFQKAMAEAQADVQLHGSLLLVDIDHFKRINDRFGHAAGDRVLVEVARRLTEAMREQDLVVRWGGEEFLIHVRDSGAAEVDRLAQRLLDAVAGQPVAYEGRAIGVTASVGYASFPLGKAPLALSWERAIDLVDTTMYLAKAHGRNRGYGVRALQAASPTDVAEVAASLEDAWRAGRVTLQQLQGPPPRGMAP